MEGVEEPLSVGFWNSNALVADDANDFCADAPDFESHRSPRVRIFHRVRKQIRENVPEQAFIGLDLGRQSGNRQFDRTLLARSRKEVVHESSQECPQVQCTKLEIHLTRVEAADQQHLLHYSGHAARVVADGSQMVLAFGRLQLAKEILQDFRRRLYSAQRLAVLLRHHGNEVASQLAQLLLSSQRADQLGLGLFALGDVVANHLNKVPVVELDAGEKYFHR